MTVPRFYVPQALHIGSELGLEGEQARQLQKVLRARPGDRVVLFDGSGAEAQGIITRLHRGLVTCRVDRLEVPCREPRIRLTVGLALLKPASFELAAQKLTELGVAQIAPLIAERSVANVREADAWAGRGARLRRIVIEAAEQAERVTLPDVLEPLSLADFLLRYKTIALVERSAVGPPRISDSGVDIALAVGPEGGWSPMEMTLIAERAADLASLGDLILRAETAAIAASAILLQQAYTGKSDC